jgi:thiol-disulfide isomerase/thioredoxin
MANTRKPTRRTPPPPPPRRGLPPRKRRNGLAVALVVAAVVLLAAAVAAVATRGGDDKVTVPTSSPRLAAGGLTATSASATPTSVSATTANASTTTVPIAQNRPVTVQGPDLAPYPQQANAPDPGLGQLAPTLVGQSFDGSAVTIGGPAQHPTLVAFVAHWCPHCNVEVPRLVQWINAGGPPKDLRIVAVSTGVDKSAPNYPPSSWLAKLKWPEPVMADSADNRAAQAYGLAFYPYLVVLGPDGKVLGRTTGELELSDLNNFVTTSLAKAAPA